MWVTYIDKHNQPFDLNKIEEGSLISPRTKGKPDGGLWTSPVFSHASWYDWCASEQPDWIDDYVTLLNVEGCYYNLDPTQSLRSQVGSLDGIDGVIYTHPNGRQSNPTWWDLHPDFYCWDADTVWLKNGSVISDGIVLPTMLFSELVEANRMLYPRFVVSNPLHVNLRDILCKLLPNTL
jgi:hypothetical protein